MSTALSPSRAPGAADRGGGAVHQAERAGGEETGLRVQVAGGGEGDPGRMLGQAAGGAAGAAARVPDQQPRVVLADRLRADQDGVAARPDLVHPVQVGGAGQDQPPRARVVQVAVGRGGAGQEDVGTWRHAPSVASGGRAVLYWSAMLETVNPATGEVLATFPVHGRREVDAAVAQAREAAVWWAGLGWSGRRIRLLAWKSHLTRYMGRLAQLVHDETGKPLDDAKLEIILAIVHIDWAARHARRVLRPRRVRSGLAAINQASTVEYQPLGVVGVIGPWNYPVFTPVGSIAYALAAGNAVVFKPSELTPATGDWLVRSFGEALDIFGDSQPVFQLVTGPGSTGEALARSGVAKIAFTGSAATARKVMAAAADTLTPVLAECGGKDALLVSADADLDAAADAAAWGAMSNAGQTCIGIERVYVADAVYQQLPGAADPAGVRAAAGVRQRGVLRADDAAVAAGDRGQARGGRAGPGGRPVVGGPDAVAAPYVRPVILTDVPEHSDGGDRGDVRADRDGDAGGEPGRGGLVRQRGALRARVGGVRSRSFGGHDGGTVAAHRDDLGQLRARVRDRAGAAFWRRGRVGVRADSRRGRAARVHPAQGHHAAADAAADQPHLVRPDRPGHAADRHFGYLAARPALPAPGSRQGRWFAGCGAADLG